jgi:hypothetical protein
LSRFIARQADLLVYGLAQLRSRYGITCHLFIPRSARAGNLANWKFTVNIKGMQGTV